MNKSSTSLTLWILMVVMIKIKKKDLHRSRFADERFQLFCDMLLTNTLKEETFPGRNFRGFAVFSRESLFPRKFSKYVIRESFFPRNFLKKSSSAKF